MHVVIFVTAKDQRQARKMAEGLIREKFAACACHNAGEGWHFLLPATIGPHHEALATRCPHLDGKCRRRRGVDGIHTAAGLRPGPGCRAGP